MNTNIPNFEIKKNIKKKLITKKFSFNEHKYLLISQMYETCIGEQ